MLQWLGNMFGTASAAERVIDNVSKGIDKLWYTEEEKSEDRMKAVKEGNAVYMEWLRSTMGSRVARRFIAVVVTVLWALQWLASLILSVAAVWVDPSLVDPMLASAEIVQTSGIEITGAMMVVLGFYFLGNKADGFIKVALEKFQGKDNKEVK